MKSFPLSLLQGKRTLLVVVVVCLVCGSLYAQPRLDKPEYYLGFHAGAIASMVMFTPDVPQQVLDPFLGANGGLVFRYSGHKVCGLQIELNYMQRGWKEEQTGYVRQIDYIELPLLTHIAFGKKFRGFINLGPQVGYAFRETATLPTPASAPARMAEQSRSLTALSAYGVSRSLTALSADGGAQYSAIEKPFDWGLAGGLGMLYRSNKAGTYQIEARFNYSFGDIFSNHKTDYFSRSSHMNLSLNFAWLWEFK